MHIQQKRMEELVNDFFDKLKNKPSYRFDFLDVAEIVSNKNKWNDWPGKTGVYAFVNETDVFYVGRARKGSYLGKRIDENTKSGNQSPWKKIIEKPSTKIIVCMLMNEQDDFRAASLEIYLIDNFLSKKWLFNKKRG